MLTGKRWERYILRVGLFQNARARRNIPEKFFFVKREYSAMSCHPFKICCKTAFSVHHMKVSFLNIKPNQDKKVFVTN